MRLVLLLSAAASLAACDSPDLANRTTRDAAGAPEVEGAPKVQGAPAPAKEVPALPTAESAAIPIAFLGVYDRDEAACAAPGEYRMEVRADEIRFHESSGKVHKVTILGQDRASVEAAYQGEGESWTNVRELRLSDGGRTITVSGDGTNIVRRRCAGAPAD
jgi:hypothetical protein